MGVGESGQEPQQQNQHPPPDPPSTHISLLLIHLPQLTELFSLKIGLFGAFAVISYNSFQVLSWKKIHLKNTAERFGSDPAKPGKKTNLKLKPLHLHE